MPSIPHVLVWAHPTHPHHVHGPARSHPQGPCATALPKAPVSEGPALPSAGASHRDEAVACGCRFLPALALLPGGAGLRDGALSGSCARDPHFMCLF